MTIPRILAVFGTRPEAIKLAPVVRALRRRPDRASTLVCTTGQHREMLDQVLQAFEIHPDLDLGLMTPGQTLARLTADAMVSLDRGYAALSPDIVLVQGDTTTAMIAALTAFYRKVAVGHVEAGLRTGDRYRPFPEEINRRMIGGLATWHFAPTASSAQALLSENVPRESIHVTGNTVIDALLDIVGRDDGAAPLPYPAPGRRLVLVTAHRRESFGAPFENLCRALAEIALRLEDVEIVYPVHLNPNVQEPVRRILGNVPRVHLVEPLDYITFARTMKKATLILTDSGGIQEEAPSLGVPVLVMREETERPEAVQAGVARLVGTDPATIVPEAIRLLTNENARLSMRREVSPFGDGRASERIAEVLLDGRAFPPDTGGAGR